MKNDRNNIFFPQMMPFGMPNNMMFPNYMNDNNYNNLENKLNNLEKKIKTLETRVSRLEAPYQNQGYQNYQSNQVNTSGYQTTQTDTNYNGEMYMM